jgi:predicted nucleic acid-binding protein
MTRRRPRRLSVPATERAFTELPPQQLYVDTDFILNYLLAPQPHHARVVPFVLRLAEQGLTTLHISALSWIELAHVVRRQAFRDALPPEWQQNAQLASWERPAVRAQYLSDWVGLVHRLLAQFAWNEVAVTPEVSVRALQHVATYSLGPQDAVHLACAQEAGVLDLASFDAGFRRVDGLFLWNDCIHGHNASSTASTPSAEAVPSMRGYVLDYYGPLASDTDPIAPRRPRRRGVYQTPGEAQQAAWDEARRDDRILGEWRRSELPGKGAIWESDAAGPGGVEHRPCYTIQERDVPGQVNAYSCDVNLTEPHRGTSPELMLESLKRAHETQMGVYFAMPGQSVQDEFPVRVLELRETSPGIWHVQVVEIPAD